jgi:predicted transcriptional regulator
MSDLRTRIAAVIKCADESVYEETADPFAKFRPASYDDLADAVIAALDLRIEDRYRSASGEQQYVGVSGFFAVKGETDDE